HVTGGLVGQAGPVRWRAKAKGARIGWQDRAVLLVECQPHIVEDDIAGLHEAAEEVEAAVPAGQPVALGILAPQSGPDAVALELRVWREAALFQAGRDGDNLEHGASRIQALRGA